MSGHTLVNPLSIGVSTLGNTAGNTGLTQVPVVFVGAGVASLAQTSGATQATIQISVPVGAGGVAAYGVSTGGNTLGTTGAGTGTIVIAAIGGATASQATAAGGRTVSISVAAAIPIATAVKAVAAVGSTGTITRYAPEDHQHVGVVSAGVGTDGNSAGTTGLAPGSLQIVGGFGITASQSSDGSGATVTLQAAGSNEVVSRIGVSTGGSTLGDTGTRLGTIVFEGVGGAILSQSTAAGNNATIRISAGVAARQASVWVPYDGIQTTKTSIDGLLTFFPIQVVPNIAATRAVFQNNVVLTTAVVGTTTIGLQFGIYTFSGSTASQASSASSTFSGSSDGVSISALRYASLGLGTWNMTPGPHAIVVNYMTTTAGAAGTCQIRPAGAGLAPNSPQANFLGTNVAATDMWGAGVFSVTTAALPASFHVTDIVLSGASVASAVMPGVTFHGTF